MKTLHFFILTSVNSIAVKSVLQLFFEFSLGDIWITIIRRQTAYP